MIINVRLDLTIKIAIWWDICFLMRHLFYDFYTPSQWLNCIFRHLISKDKYDKRYFELIKNDREVIFAETKSLLSYGYDVHVTLDDVNVI